MFKFLQSKKGFTLVELMIVVVLLGLGAVALMNLFGTAYKSFTKAEERRVKQEQVKLVVEQLQRTYRVGSASNAYYGTSIDGFLPTKIDDANTYIYTKYETAAENVNGKEGCYLYIIPTGSDPAKPVCVNPEIPLMIWFEPCTRVNTKGETVNVAGVNVHIAALENDSEYTEDYADGVFNEPPKMDNIYYQLDVAYHFPNMVEAGRSVSEISKKQDDGIAAQSDEDKPLNIILQLAIDKIDSGDKNDAQAGATSFCFIATASYGQDSGQVGALCEFRDKCLLTNPLGTAFVNAYYKLSPPVADVIRESEPLKAIVRTALNPLLVISEYALNEEIRTEGIASIAIFMLCGLTSTAVLVRVDKRIKKNK